MKQELLSKAFGNMDDCFVSEAYRPVFEDASNAAERIEHLRTDHSHACAGMDGYEENHGCMVAIHDAIR